MESGSPALLRLFRALYGLVQVVDAFVQVAVGDAAIDPVRVHLDAESYALVHGDGQRLGAAHAAEARGEADAAAQRPPEALLGDGGECLVGALEDALGADVDPGPRRHLAVHREPGPLQLPERLPVGPLGDQQRVGDQNPRSPGVGPEDGYGFARLDQQRLVIVEALQGADDGPEALPVSGGLARPAVDDEVFGAFGYLGVEVVHEHAEGRLLVPALAGKLPPPRRADGRSFSSVRHGNSFPEVGIQSCTGSSKCPAWKVGRPDQQHQGPLEVPRRRQRSTCQMGCQISCKLLNV